MTRVFSLRNLLCLLCAAFLLAGCQKVDFIKNLLLDQRPNRCDWTSATNGILFDFQEREVPFLFQKKYKHGSSELRQIIASYRNIATPAVTAPDTMNVIYKDQRIIFIRLSGDTVAMLTFGLNAKLLKAAAVPFMRSDWNLREEFRFSYTGNRLREITYFEDNKVTWPYIRVQYDKTNKNVSKVLFGNLTNDFYQDSIVYQYDYSKKARGQFYPDEMLGDHFNFWYFLKFLNVLDGVQPENVLLNSYMTNSYPGDIERSYTAHKFDSKGNLIYYKQHRNIPQLPFYEEWQVDWRCY